MKASPEIQILLHFTSQAGILHECLKVTLVPNGGKLLQNSLSFKSRQRSLKHGHCTRRQYGYHASLSMISLRGLCVGRGRVPFHGPTIRQRVRPWHRLSGVVRGLPEQKVTMQD
jgi:hypothetical protein